MSSREAEATFCSTFYNTDQNLCSKVWTKLYKHISVTPQNTDGGHTQSPTNQPYFDFKWRKCKISSICARKGQTPPHSSDPLWPRLGLHGCKCPWSSVQVCWLIHHSRICECNLILWQKVCLWHWSSSRKVRRWLQDAERKFNHTAMSHKR